MKPRILVIDDEKNIRRTLALIFQGEGWSVAEAGSGEEGLKQLLDDAYDLVLLDVKLPGRDGLSILGDIGASQPALPVIMISGEATVALAVQATQAGAVDFLEKPLARDRVLLSARNALRLGRLDADVRYRRRSEERRSEMIGRHPSIEALRRQIAKLGPSNATVLIGGESGTGKELVAQALHRASPRSGGPFVKVNCAAIPEELIESELFGCVRGAFTGADRSRDGRFLLADGGTLFLDEVGDMSLRVQSKVLRALQEGEIERVGDPKSIRVDVRVLAATNKQLEDEVTAGRFREDLFYRLNVVPVLVPALRERREDIPLLASHFLALLSDDAGGAPRSLSKEAATLLASAEWRGNVRELRNVVERLAILAEGSTITEDDVRLFARIDQSSIPTSVGPVSLGSSAATAPLDAIQRAGGLLPARRQFEIDCIEAALDHSGGNVSEAARLLGLERSNLHKKMQSYGLEARPPRAPRPDS